MMGQGLKPVTPEKVAWALSIMEDEEKKMANDELEDLEAVEKAANEDRERERQEFAKLAEVEKAKEVAHANMRQVIAATRSQIVTWRAVKMNWQRKTLGVVEPSASAEVVAATLESTATDINIPKWPGAKIAG